MATVANVVALSRQMLGDVGNSGAGEWFVDSIAVPFVIRGYRKAQRILRSESKNAVGIVERQSADITVTAGSTNLTRPAGAAPNFPADLIRPTAMRERAMNVSPYIDMKSQKRFMPDQPAGDIFGIWAWRDDTIWVPAATEDRQVQILYDAAFTDLVDTTSTLAIQDMLDPLAAMTAAAGARMHDEKTLADTWDQQALEDLGLIAAAEKAAQVARGVSFGVGAA